MVQIVPTMLTKFRLSLVVGGASEGPNSYYVEQEAVQKNFACFSSECSNNLTQIQGGIGSASGSESQKAQQYNIGCFDSMCTNEEFQTESGK